MILARLDRDRLRELVRFYQAAIVNTIFGISCYVILVRAGLNLFLAQGISHVLGVAFNYYTYSSHVFHESSPAKIRFFLSYVVYYFVNLGVLFAIHQFVVSPYISGIAAAFVTSVINYFSLKLIVFRKRPK